MIDIVTGRSKSAQFFINLIPKNFRLIFNPNRRCIEKFIEKSAKKIEKGAKILDAGAGPCPYRKFFSHCNYEATDFIDRYKILDFVCQLDNIPKKKDTYDAILCTEVLEHVEYPQKVVNELYRVLKKNGKLFLTVPQAWMIHQEPYNFYYFTKYGLASILKNAGFKEYKIIPKGGYFWFLADAIRFNEIARQYKKYPLIYYPLKILTFPFTSIIFPFILFYLDFLDKEKKWTMGYVVEAKK